MSTKGLEKYKEDVAQGLVTKVPPEYNLIRKLEKDPRSWRKAIDAMCFHCVGGTRDHMPDSGWRLMVSTCTSKDCPLLAFRPCPTGEILTETEEGIPDEAAIAAIKQDLRESSNDLNYDIAIQQRNVAMMELFLTKI